MVALYSPPFRRLQCRPSATGSPEGFAFILTPFHTGWLLKQESLKGANTGFFFFFFKIPG